MYILFCLLSKNLKMIGRKLSPVHKRHKETGISSTGRIFPSLKKTIKNKELKFILSVHGKHAAVIGTVKEKEHWTCDI